MAVRHRDVNISKVMCVEDNRESLRTFPEHICFHDLRHTCATLLLAQGTHPKLVQELLGHATIAVRPWIPTHTFCRVWETRP